MKKTDFLISFAISCLFSVCYCGNVNRADSVLNLIKADKMDTLKLAHLNWLSGEYAATGNYFEALRYGKEALELSGKLIPVTNQIRKGIAQANNNVGNIYMDHGEYVKALDCYFISLRKHEEIGNKLGMAYEYGNIGVIYDIQGDYDKALDYDMKGFHLDEELDDKNEMIASLGNIGIVYAEKMDYPNALEYLEKALHMAEKMENKAKVISCLGNIGVIYDNQDNYAKALEYYEKSLHLEEALKNRRMIALTLSRIGSIYTSTKKYREAFTCLYQSLAISDSLKVLHGVKHAYELLMTLYQYSNVALPDTLGGKILSVEEMRLQALKLYKKSIAIKDTLFSQENKKELVRKEMNFEFARKEAITQAEHEREAALAAEESKRQRLFILLIGALFLGAAVIAIVIMRSLRITRRQKIIIAEQKHLVERQKELVEEKHKEILDSINYAERIQRALLASKQLLQTNLNSYFLLFKPKDIVSGDFYWATRLANGNFVLVTADSTGHGVPGAIMSILNIACLDKAVTKGISSPDLLLNETRKLIVENLRNDGSREGGKDGMDCSLLSLDFKNKILYLALANNPVWIIRRGELLEIKPDRMPVGRHEKEHVSFVLHTFNLETGDMIYTLTDGFADQFGGESGKKFKYKKLQELLISTCTLPMQAQHAALNKAFEDWKGNLEQVDDVCLIGFRI
jgi:serine phosphatase RsbU (regulator of sigma subunit)